MIKLWRIKSALKLSTSIKTLAVVPSFRFSNDSKEATPDYDAIEKNKEIDE
jgi:hypothetical protein